MISVSEIAELVNGSFLEKAPLIKVSAINNVGIDNLRKVIIDICNKLPIRQDRGIFRMHIDRVFSKKGYGTVVTGTVNSGSIKSGDTLEIIPGNIKTKIRSLQSHGLDVNEVALGDRAAINLQGVDKELVKRGSQLAEIGYLQSIKKMGVSINLLNSQKKVITQNQRIRVHLGTQEVMARVALIGRKLLNPGKNTAALLRLETPLVAAKNDKFIIRSYSPIITIGGGEVIEVVIEDKWKIIKTKIQELFDKPNSDQLPKLIEHQGANLLSIEQLKFRLGISEQKIKSIVNNIDELIWKKYNQNMWLVTIKQWSILIEKIILFVKKFHNKNPMEKGVVKEKIRQDLQSDESVLEALLLDMENNKLIIREGKILSDPRFKLALNSEDDALQTNILKILDIEGFASSNLSELSNKINQPKEKIIQILKVAEKQGKILRIEGNLMFTKNNFIKLQKRIILHFKHKSTLSISEFKEISKTSRKYAVPLLEYFDKLKITYRDGNVRKIIK